MKEEHRKIQEQIKRRYSSKFQVAAEIDAQNRLPNKETHIYQPDVVLRDKNDTGTIRYIIEVENDPVRKALVGAAILADYAVGKCEQKSKPNLLFIVYSDKGIRQMNNFRAKLKIAKAYCRNIAEVEICSKNDFDEKKLQ